MGAQPRTLWLELGNSRRKAMTDSGDAWQPVAEADMWSGFEQVVVLPTAPAQLPAIQAACVARRLPCTVLGFQRPAPQRGHYPSMGLDRIAAGLALEGANVIIDAGTVCTVTAWNAQGRYVDGLMVPGLQACAAAMHHAAPALPLVVMHAERPSAPTASAMVDGVRCGWPAMVAAACRTIQERSGISQIVITGGDARLLRDSLPNAEHLPECVFIGMRRWMAMA